MPNYWEVYRELMSTADFSRAASKEGATCYELLTEKMPGEPLYDSLPPSTQAIAKEYGEGNYLIAPSGGEYGRLVRTQIVKKTTVTYEEV